MDSRKNRRRRNNQNLPRANGPKNPVTSNNFSNNKNFSSSKSSKSQNNVIRISLKAIEELKNKNPEDILLQFLNPRFGFDSYLNAETMGDDLIYNLTFVILKSLECNSMNIRLKEISEKIIESKFFKKHIYDSINTLDRITRSYKTNLIELVLKLTTHFLFLNPYYIENLSAIKDRLELLVLRINTQDLKILFQEYAAQEEDSLKKIQKQKYTTFTNIEADSEPLEDFTTMNVVPKLSDLLAEDQEIFLRKNITNGSYKDVHHYLDVQFRLLREDFMQPLRDGVWEFRKIVHGSGRKFSSNLSKEMIQEIKKIENLNTYFDVCMSNSIPADQGIVFQMQIDPNKFKSINWETSKRLIYGSLVCFSSDYFLKECLIGIICERDAKDFKKKGCFNVKFDYDSIQLNFNAIPEINKSYIMLETSAFFESYKHVLKALQSFQREGENDFPFKENLVYCQNRDLPIPKYLKEASIDFRTLVEKKNKVKYNYLTKLYDYKFSECSSYAENCLITNEASWPSAKQMKLDEKQYEAIKLVLTKKLALIQGPPGTGKTFIGVKIVQLLLNNKHTWWNREREKHKPILMICYTNHALDQFLEYCIKECNLNQGIVRVGGRSKSENLEPFLLKNIKQKMRQERKLNKNVFHRIHDQIAEVSRLKSKICHYSTMLNSIFFGKSILSLNILKNFMSQDHLNQLIEYGYNFQKHGLEQDYYLIDWLGLFVIDQDQSLINDFEELDLTDNNRGEIITGNYEDKDQDDETYEQDNNPENLTLQQNTDNNDNDSLNEERMLDDDFDKIDLTKIKTKLNANNDLLDINCLNEMIKNFKTINGINNSGWKIKARNKKKVDPDYVRLENNLKEIFSHLTNKFSESDLEILENTNNIWRLNYPERFLLYFQWLKKYTSDLKIQLNNLSNQYNMESAALQEIRLQEDRIIMENAFIIAMTTTGSSRYHSVLKDIGPRIVIVEEAAEVFEAHIVSALSKNCEHLILIGDHVQLRPNPAVYKLAKTYHLDVSLFERLINNDTKRVMLNNQHRMRPEISKLMHHFYEQKINDDKSVMNYPNINGLKKNVFFIEHSELEKRLNDNTTKINSFEADYLARLCLYLIKQDYNQSNITVLSMYLGQMIEIRKRLQKLNLFNIKVSTVDNYQGEENDIILLSLVRSNLDGKIGFLSIKNRVCVALSRARHGLFVIGNFKFICESDKANLWTNVIETIKMNQFYGSGLTVTCGNHPENDIEIIRPEDFDKRPDGGCHLPCGFRLQCGHVCIKKCHYNADPNHINYKCLKPCGKKIEKCNHLCNQICSKEHECVICNIKVDKIIHECGHQIKFRCDTEPKRKDCIKNCDKLLECGHLCIRKCNDTECFICLTPIQKISNCIHKSIINVLCSDPEWTYQTKCTKPCNQILECGHICSGTCGDCFGGRIHKNCIQNCDRLLFCSHKCTIPCAKQCEPCQKECQNKCEHSKCHSKCSVPCAPCKEKCKNSCQHSECSKFCYELCDIKPCDYPCKKKLKCGHECIGLCGELCPKWCRICDKEKVGEIFFGTEDEPDARFIRLNECKHIIEVSGMDNWISSRFDFDENNNQGKNNTIQLPDCPKCKTPIRKSKRYSNIIKKQLKLIEDIKLKQFGDSKENQRIQDNLIKDIKNYDLDNKTEQIDFEIQNAIFKKLEKPKTLSFNSLAALKNTWNIYVNLKQIYKNFLKIQNEKKDKDFFKFEINKILNLLVINNEISMLKGQRLNDILRESQRISNLVKLFNLKKFSKPNNFEEQLMVDSYFNELELKLIKNVTKFDEKLERNVESLFKKLSSLLRAELTQEEKIMIVKAMDLSQGHWFKCQNGHIYCIGECGGAMQKSVCPECKCEIGGQSHRLVESNRLASEMDGASQPAWPNTV